MKILKEKSFILLICVNILVILCSTFWIKISYNQYKDQTNQKISKLVELIEEKYPDVDEETIISEINKIEKTDLKNTILNKYGISDKISAIQGFENTKNSTIKNNVIALTIIFIIEILLYTIFYFKRQNGINEVLAYIDKINSKDYTLQIEKNGEDELSNLRNELYKIVIILKEEAEKSQNDKKALSVALEDISHQLKTPLTSISIMIDNLIENPNMDQITKSKFLHEIRRQLEWINWLVISLLKLSKLDSNTVEFNRKEFLVSDIIENLVQNLSVPLEIKNQEICVKGEENAKIYADYNWQLEAMSNILKNCIEHTAEGKKIHITFSENNFYTSIRIEDEGNGINKEELKHIFERFYKGKSSNENSIGIGLALAKTIIEKDNGYIICSSQINKGTMFEIRYMKTQSI